MSKLFSHRSKFFRSNLPLVTDVNFLFELFFLTLLDLNPLFSRLQVLLKGGNLVSGVIELTFTHVEVRMLPLTSSSCKEKSFSITSDSKLSVTVNNCPSLPSVT